MLKFEELLKLKEYQKIREKVFKTIKKYNLIDKNDRILVALSGGKDSSVLTLLLKDYIENKLKKELKDNLLALYVDVGIKEHKKQIERAKKLCEFYKIPFKIIKADLKIDELSEKEKNLNACRICGIEKRHFFLKVAIEEGFNTIATGHNLNDEAETFLMNILQNNYKAAKENFIIKKVQGLPKKIKPLYFVNGKNIRELALKIGLFKEIKKECPYSKESFRNFVRNFLEEAEKLDKSILNKIINFQINFLNEINELKKQKVQKEKETRLKVCKICGLPSTKEICKFCELVSRFKDF
jgi:uncharacterized protein (TIGR00269 family)